VEDSPAPRNLVALQAAGPMPLASLRSLWWRLPAVAAAYFAAARVGFLLDLEPGFASSIWPAAGIGSAALLVWGPRLWPGVLIGSFLFNWWLSDLLLAEMPGTNSPLPTTGKTVAWSPDSKRIAYHPHRRLSALGRAQTSP
jgi:hypothetical protein